jgi:hypothetical protein
MSTRKTAWQSLTFDHGCQFFHAQSADMRNVVRDWVEAGEQHGQLTTAAGCSSQTSLVASVQAFHGHGYVATPQQGVSSQGCVCSTGTLLAIEAVKQDCIWSAACMVHDCMPVGCMLPQV